MKQKNLYKLPPPDCKYGYSAKAINKICSDRNIKTNDFWFAFGVNTIAVVDGVNNYYVCDVERTLYHLNAKGGQFHLWD